MVLVMTLSSKDSIPTAFYIPIDHVSHSEHVVVNILSQVYDVTIPIA